MIESIFADLTTKLLIASSTRVRNQLGTALARRRDGKTQGDAVAELIAIDRALTSKRFLSVDLPPNFDFKQLTEFMQDASSQAIAFECISASLAGAQSPEMDKIHERWKVESTPLLTSLSEEQRATFINQLFTALEAEAEYITKSMEERHPDIIERVREHARHNRLYAIMEALERRASAYQPTAAEKAVEDLEWLKVYRSQARAAHGHLTPPDFDRRRSVPIEDLYVSPSIVGHPQLKTDIMGLAASIDRSVLLGDPGGGKTTATTVLMHHFASSSDHTVPFVVVLRDFASDGKPRTSIVDHIEERLNAKYQCEPPQGTVERLLESGKALVVFDGLDELLDTSLRREVTDSVSLFCNRYPLTRVLVTSRLVGYDQAAMDPRTFSKWEIAGFDDKRVEEYVGKWFTQDDSLDQVSARSWTNAFMRESAEVSDLRTNPLLLALMCIIYRGEQSLPKNRPAVYEKCATMLFEKWDSHRTIHTSLQVGPLVDPAMKYLAYWMITTPNTSEGVTESRLVSETTEYLKTRTFEDELEAEVAAREFVEFCRGRAWVFSDAGTTAEGESLYKFTHRTFMEYFAAYHLARRNDSPEKLGRQLAMRVANAEWDVIAQLAIQIADKHTDSGADRIFRFILQERVKRTRQKRANQLAFLARCLPFAIISPACLRDLTRQIVMDVFATIQTDSLDSEKSPLLPLLSSRVSPQTQSLLTDELRRLVERKLESSDEATRRMGFIFLAGAWLTPYLSRSRGQNREYWRDFFFSIIDSYKDDFLAISEGDDLFSYYAVARGYTDVVSAYELSPSDFSPILVSIWDRMWNAGLWSSAQALFQYWLGVVSEINHITTDSRISLSALAKLAESGARAIIRNSDQVSTLTDMTFCLLKSANLDVSKPDIALTPQERRGLHLLYMASFEALEQTEGSELLDTLANRNLSGLEDLKPYLLARAHADQVPVLPDPSSVSDARWRSFVAAWATGGTSVLALDPIPLRELKDAHNAPYIQSLISRLTTNDA